ncbi:MAG TPA: M67 family metallopeptidase [Anaerolineaceae bacterium]|jgi:proteasome lid subunit RPN8/RPN11
MIEIPTEMMRQITQHGETAYPEEAAGFLLGADGEPRRVKTIFRLENAREEDARRNRYLITPQDMLSAEREAVRLGKDVIGVFHSHPDHPDRPSSFDLEWALPWFSYVITNIENGLATESRCWRLKDDRSSFIEEEIGGIANR